MFSSGYLGDRGSKPDWNNHIFFYMSAAVAGLGLGEAFRVQSWVLGLGFNV